MKVSDLIKALQEHADKDIFVGIPMQSKDGEPGLALAPCNCVEIDGAIVMVPEQGPTAAGMTKAMLEELIPASYLNSNVHGPSRLERISGDVDKVVEFFEKHNIMRTINARSGQENDPKYMAYCVQAYYQGVLK